MKKESLILMRLLTPLFLLFSYTLSLSSLPYSSQRSHRQSYARLDPTSIPQQLAFYSLYPTTPEGLEARKRASQLLGGGHPSLTHTPPDLTLLFELGTREMHSLTHLVHLFSRPGWETESPQLSESLLTTIEELASWLPNRVLRGHKVWNQEELLSLDSDEIDLARGMLIMLCQDDLQTIRQYEAHLDLLALQALARAPLAATPQEKIATLNHYLFDELHLRFPPHSLFAKEIDLYTFLPQVLDSRRGVCLGVSALYLALAQRLDLELEIVTPPGHIYLRYRQEKGHLNIETTARGVHIESEEYLGVGCYDHHTRALKEVVGMTFFNQAAALWQAKRIEEAIVAYRKARLFMPDDLLCKEFLGYLLCLTGAEEEGHALLQEVVDIPHPYSTSPNSMPRDLLEGRVNPAGVSVVFSHVDETRLSILKKQEELKRVLQDYPDFKQGWFHLAGTYLQLGRGREATETLLHYRELEPEDPLGAYYLAALSAERHDFPTAWKELQEAESLSARFSYLPKALRSLRRGLRLASPK